MDWWMTTRQMCSPSRWCCGVMILNSWKKLLTLPPMALLTRYPHLSSKVYYCSRLHQHIRDKHPHSHNQCSTLSKSHGHLLKLATVHYSVEQALKWIKYHHANCNPIPPHGNPQSPSSSCTPSSGLTAVFYCQKFAIVAPPQLQTVPVNHTIGTNFVTF